MFIYGGTELPKCTELFRYFSCLVLWICALFKGLNFLSMYQFLRKKIIQNLSGLLWKINIHLTNMFFYYFFPRNRSKKVVFFQKISVKSHEFCAYLRTVEVASLSCSSHAVSKLAAGIETPSNPNFVVQSMTPSLIIKWIRSRARLIWQKTVSRFSRAEGLDSMCLLEWIELVMDSIQYKNLFWITHPTTT